MDIRRRRYCISRSNRLIDLEPMIRDKNPLVWDSDQHEWVELDWTLGEHVDSLPITDEEAERFMATGEISRMHATRRADMSDDSSGDKV